MELRHLRYFIAVAEEGHITRAAARLGMQQPPLSLQIRALERELNVQLFRRKARGVELTDPGRAFLGEAREMLRHLDRACEATRRAARGEQGQICVAVTSTSPFNPLVPRSIRAFRETNPLVSLTLEECLSNEAIERLLQERLDAAFLRIMVPQGKDLAVTPLLDEPMVVALPSTHHLAATAPDQAVALDVLASETFILYGPPGTGMYDAIITACHTAGFNPRVGDIGSSTQQAPRIGSTLCLISAGLGITFVPESLQRVTVEGVIFRRVTAAAPPKSVLNLATRRGVLSPVLRQFVKTVKALSEDANGLKA